MNEAGNERPVDVATVGETMVAFVGRPGSRDYTAVTAGAESNVAAGVAALGFRSRWVSRLGDDDLGRFVSEGIAALGVEVDVTWDDRHPTGAMTKHIGDDRTRRVYYRSRSAARLLSPADAARVGPSRWIHLTGITPAISPTAADLVTLLADHRPGSARMSFDVNLRPELWPDLGHASQAIVDIARRADLILIGDDEARALLGTDDVEEVAAAIVQREDQELVLKRGSGPATSISAEGTATVSPLPTAVLDLTGAGDAFAAGCLAGHLREWPAAARLRLGHVLASRVIATAADVVPPLGPDELELLTPEALERRWSAPG